MKESSSPGAPRRRVSKKASPRRGARLDIHAVEPDGVVLVDSTSLHQRTERTLPPGRYVVTLAVPGRASRYFLADQDDLPRVIREVEKFPRTDPPAEEPTVLDFARHERELEAYLRAQAPHLLLLVAYDRHGHSIGGAAEVDSAGQPVIETLPAGASAIRGHDGIIVYTSEFGAFAIKGPIYTKWLALQQAAIARGAVGWGYPTSAETDGDGGQGRRQGFRPPGAQVKFQAAIHWSPASGAWAVEYPFFVAYGLRGSSAGELRLPTSDKQDFNWHGPWVARQIFQLGRLYLTYFEGQRVSALVGPMYVQWKALGEEVGVGLPLTDVSEEQGVLLQHFRRSTGWNATLLIRDGVAVMLWGVIRDRWLGDRRAAYGWPVSTMLAKGNVLTVTFERYRVEWNGLAADHPECVYREISLAPAPSAPPFVYQELDKVDAGGGSYFYSRRILGNYQDLLWVGGLSAFPDAALLVGSQASLYGVNSLNTRRLSKGDTLGVATFAAFYGTSTQEVTLYAKPVKQDGSLLAYADAPARITIGLQARS